MTPDSSKSLTFTAARATVLREVQAHRILPPTQLIPIDSAPNRVLAADAKADRDYPPFNRATRDGFALRTQDIPTGLKIIGESRAGTRFPGILGPNEAVEIMTGAPVPEGADAVVMIEHVRLHPEDNTVSTDRTLAPNTNIAHAGSEAHTGNIILPAGTRIDYTAIAWLATIGNTSVLVYNRPRVAILATGDEIVELGTPPGPDQIRNSNAHTLAAQVRRAGGDPTILPIAPDTLEATQALIEEGLKYDLLLLSGGVSAGKYDVVEPALKELGAHFYFDQVDIQPGKPLVFGRAQNTFFFGLPGNPASTMVTFEIFARAALDLLSGTTGINAAPLPLTLARLTRPFTHKPGLTRFLPAILSCTEVTPVDWQGSGDVPSICRANAFLVADAGQSEYAAGDLIPVLIK